MRKYQRYWELLKRDKRIVLQMQDASGVTMTPAKAQIAYKKFVRGIQKEKYHDIVYRASNNNAVLSGDLSFKDFTATFTLADTSLVATLPETL